jgi:hypothetical protein
LGNKAMTAAERQARFRATEASTTAEALRAICDLDLSDIESVEPPHGFGRDSCKGSLSPARFFYEPSGLTPAR